MSYLTLLQCHAVRLNMNICAIRKKYCDFRFFQDLKNKQLTANMYYFLLTHNIQCEN